MNSDFWLMADCLDVMSVRGNDKRAIVVWMVVLSNTGWSVVDGAGLKSCLMERSDLRTIFRMKSNMHGFLRFGVCAKPEFRFAVFPEAGPTANFHDELNAKWRKRFGKKLFALLVVADRESNMVNYHGLPQQKSNWK